MDTDPEPTMSDKTYLNMYRIVTYGHYKAGSNLPS